MPPATQAKVVASTSGLNQDNIEDIAEVIQIEMARKQKLENDHTEWKMKESHKNPDDI
jgi:hypothetical protein